MKTRGAGLIAALLTLLSGSAVPFTPIANAEVSVPSMSALVAPAAAATTAPAATSTSAYVAATELSPTPPNLTQAVAPNIVVTFDDSGSMAWNHMGDTPPFSTDSNGNILNNAKDWNGGPWRCAGVIDPDHPSAGDKLLRSLPMNGVYYNPNITYSPPLKSNGTPFSDADSSLAAVWLDGISFNRPLSPNTSTSTSFANNPDLTTSGLSNLTGGLVNGQSTGRNAQCPSGTINCACTGSGSSKVCKYQTDTRWQCGTGSGITDGWSGASPMDGSSVTLSDGTAVTYPVGGPYYYRLKSNVTVTLNAAGKPSTNTDLAALYNASNWEAVPVPQAQYKNFANWYAYYRTRNQMARTSMSRVFGTLGNATADGGFGTTIRAAWQVLNNSNYKLPSSTIISALIDTKNCTAALSAAADPKGTQQPSDPTALQDCYRSAFFNWIYQVPASGGTPTRSATNRAGTFYTRSGSDYRDPYWQAPQGTSTTGKELVCRQNFHMLVTDGLWNGNSTSNRVLTPDGPSRSSLTLPSNVGKLPDGVQFPSTGLAGVTSIYAPQADAAGDGTNAASLSDIAFHYWATNLRTDLYSPANNKLVTPYLPDRTTGVVSTTVMSGSVVSAANVNNEVYFNPANDPATWPHMSQYLVGLGVSGLLNFSNDTNCTAGASDQSDACQLRKGQANSLGITGWPAPNGNGNGLATNIDDTWHAALAGRGQFFNAASPQNLVDQLSAILTSISARSAPANVSSVNTAVLVQGAIAFSTSYSSSDWSGILLGLNVALDGTIGGTVFDAGAILTDATKTDPNNRQILTATRNSDGTFSGIPFRTFANLDATAQTDLSTKPVSAGTGDTGQARLDWLRGVRTSETSGLMRTRTTLLGAIINSQTTYVSFPASGYLNTWPAGSPEAVAAAAGNTYEQFVQNNLNRKAVVYVGANDGMLHAFDASEVQDGSTPPQTIPSANIGHELFAYVPRTVFSRLGSLTQKNNFVFQPTVDATPVTRDVYFSSGTTNLGWHTILVGGLRLGGRGIYALDITDPTQVSEANAASKVLWEFNAATPATAVGDPSHLGFTYGQPNIGRLANGKWVVLVPGGYFPDCSMPDKPVNCQSVDAAKNKFSSLFVLDAQTGVLIRELQTPSTVTSYGLSSPVLGDYNNDQIDDVAFAGDLVGNLWKYDLTNTDSSLWTVSLIFQPQTNGAQPITTMPRLFPDPATNRFIVVFGTGKFLGAADNNSSTTPVTQSIYGIRDTGTTYQRSNLTQQVMVEATSTDGTNTVRGLTNNVVPSTSGGWYIDLPASGERIVVTPEALFDTNRVIVTSLIPGTADPCTASVLGAVMVIDAATGGSDDGLSNPGVAGWTGSSPYRAVGARVNNPPTSGGLPVVTRLGGGQLLIPGLGLVGGGSLSIDDAIWRRRSWRELYNNK
ncbi:MAG TPA: PilC/PilY family type IV pilus protein [Dyella sp.]|uniref:pilus assembly protein n=1 Tax=Dyella sp. TaxID=1869338 RepID=UPI002F95A2A9